jgi:hypothetical protein
MSLKRGFSGLTSLAASALVSTLFASAAHATVPNGSVYVGNVAVTLNCGSGPTMRMSSVVVTVSDNGSFLSATVTDPGTSGISTLDVHFDRSNGSPIGVNAVAFDSGLYADIFASPESTSGSPGSSVVGPSALVLDVLTFGSTCSGSISGTLPFQSAPSVDSPPDDVMSTEEEAGTVISTPVIARNSGRSTVSAVSGRTTAVFSGKVGSSRTSGGNGLGDTYRYDGGLGLAAGDLTAGLPFGVWASYTRAEYQDDFAATALRGNRNLALFGVDFQPFEGGLLGLAVGWEGNNMSTRFNQGSLESDGVTVTPYFAYQWSEHWQIDVLAGYTRTNFDQNRAAGTIRSDTDSDRYMMGGNFTGTQSFGNLTLSGRFGILWLREYTAGFTESNGNFVASNTFELSQWRFGADASYFFQNGFEAFATGTFERDFSREPTVPGQKLPADDREGFVGGAGIRFYGPAGWTGAFEWNGIFGRRNYEENNYTLFIRRDF